MFLHHQFSIILWLLLQFLDYSEQATYGSHFSSVPKKLTGQTFPVIHNINSSSNLVIVKCPGPEYKHTKITDRFSPYGNQHRLNLLYYPADEAFTWAPVMYNSSGPSFINCGLLVIKKDNSIDSTTYDWTYNLNWKNKPDIMQLEEPHKISTTLPLLDNKCGVEVNDTVVYYKDKESNIKKLELKDGVSGHVNDLYYYFIKPNDGDKMEIKSPCGIIRAINEPPQIEIKDHISTPISSGNLDIRAIKQEYVSGSYSIKLSVRGKTLVPNFYEGEEVKMKKLKFTKTGYEEIQHSNETITSSFSIQGFQLLKFSYEYPTSHGTKTTSRVFYFGPPSESYVFPNEDIVYFSNETAIQPNCSIHKFTFGYLESITVNGVTTNFIELTDEGNKKNNLKRVKDFIFMEDTKKDKITINCFYITPNGNVTLAQTFEKEKKVKVVVNDKKEEVNEVKKEKAEKEELKNKLAEKDKQLVAQSKTSFEKLKDNIGVGGGYAVVIIFSLVGIIIILLIAAVCSVKVLKPWILRKKIQSKYPNIFRFWNVLSSQNLEVYAETIHSKKYIPDKVKNQVISKKIEGGEVVESNTNTCFDSSLVSCFRDIEGEIKAHYISGVSPVRTYIISDGPTPDKAEFFWELLYREDVAVVFGIIYQEQDMVKTAHSKSFYWPKDTEKYGSVLVEFCGKVPSDIPFVTIRKFNMLMEYGHRKELIHFHISNWKEHDIPRTDRQIIQLYKEISENAGTEKVLIHASHGSGSRVFMFTYFACIFEAMKGNDTVDDPLEIIKEVRTHRYGGNISSMEFAYIIKAVVSYFYDCKMLVDVTNHQPAFYKEYEDLMFKIDGRESKMIVDIRNFLTFVNIIDDGKLKDLCHQFENVQKISEGDLRLQCKRFYTISNIEAMSKNKIRYKDVPCFDATAVNIKDKGSSDINGFIHANEFKYKCDEKERKIIMCQAPLEGSMGDMLDMIHRYKIGLIVVLVNKEEMNKGSKCFPYLNTTKKEISFGAYNLLYQGHEVGKNNFFTEYNYSVIDRASRLIHNFKLLHYLNWPDNTIPTEKQSLLGLYKRIIELRDNTNIVIHCSNGVGRTGTLAFIIYMMDVIKSRSSFDPIKCLAKIRRHRCKAVQTTTQFVFALSILYEHFKGQIERMDERAYPNFMALANGIYEKK
uniref:Protein-tyrosine-phosphatase n=1 Tax=Strongyloides stercoralis TaxID=6248 RepID=A0A0K0EAN2_STRER